MGDSLNATLFDRLGRALRPDWSRTVRARRVAAGGLVVLAGVAAVRSDPSGDHRDVVVAAHDLDPGTALTAEDVRVESWPATMVPDGVRPDPSTVAGAIPAGPVRRGEVITDVRVLGSPLAAAAAGPDARMVPVRPADAAVLDLLHPGDIVDVLAASDADPHPQLLADNAVVVLVSAGAHARDADRVVLVALPAAAANAVAAAALVQTVTLTLH